MFSLAGKSCVVTGASRGLGRAIALAYASQGADVVLTARSRDDLERLRAEIEALGRRAVVHAGDVTDLTHLRAVGDAPDLSRIGLNWTPILLPGDPLTRRTQMTSKPEYIPSPRQWVRDQVELYEGSSGKDGTTLRDTGLPVIIVTHTGNKTGAVRKTPLMRVKDGANYVLVGSMGGAPTDPVWVYNLRARPAVEIRDLTAVQAMRVREVNDAAERARLWDLAVAAFPPYAEYQAKTTRKIPVFVAEPAR